MFVFAVGCTPKITDEQLAKLRELKTESARLTTEIQKKENEKSRLERELASRRSETKDCNDKRAFLVEKLNNPTPWPNYPPPPPPPPPPAPEPKSKKKK
ncbi:hypothetical protein MASR2M18_00240 [Ignavibacteria bacterium]